jgi:hypothetical protein
MPLSEQEQRLLEEMERSLYQNDADFVATVNPRRGKVNYSVLVIGVLLGVVGIGTLVGGVILQLPLVGVLGFAVMFVGVLLAVTPPRGSSVEDAPSAPQARKASKPRSSFMDSLNDRWEKRQDGES